MDITAKITGIKYEVTLKRELREYDISDFDINECPVCCILKNQQNSYAVSKWVSPKRTRSYPFERVYNTLSHSKKITIIPVIKDEGAKGDRDFLQWDTVALMSLLDVYVVPAYYISAEKNKRNRNKITKQKFDNIYVLDKIKEIEKYHSSALHWNLKEIKESMPMIIEKIITFHQFIELYHNIKLHNISGIYVFLSKLTQDASSFIEFSRMKAEKAQTREFSTNQPKEILLSTTKSKITISNYLGGKYFLTVDEINVCNDSLSLIESKHSTNKKLPNLNDIKDGLIKMILFSNLREVKVDGIDFSACAVLQLTSSMLNGMITSDSDEISINDFILSNGLTNKHELIISGLICEAKSNGFSLILRGISK